MDFTTRPEIKFAGNRQRNYQFMKNRLTLLVISGSLLLAAPALLAQDTNTDHTNSLMQTWKYQKAFDNDRSLGEQALLPPGLKETLKLTDEQRDELKPIEDDFANTSWEYKVANQPRIDAARTAIQLARGAKNTAQIQAARKQLQQVWAGLRPYRVAAVKQITPLLTPDQLAVLEDEKNQWQENQADEANDPSAN
jgi:Spy/CpxP family protein refolding chaperone